MRIAVVGSRDYAKPALVVAVLDKVKEQYGSFVVVSGAADGPDAIAAKWARRNGMEVVEYPADWSLGKGAGMKRNATIIADSTACIAFWDGVSAGTMDSIHRARKSGMSVQVFLA